MNTRATDLPTSSPLLARYFPSMSPTHHRPPMDVETAKQCWKDISSTQLDELLHVAYQQHLHPSAIHPHIGDKRGYRAFWTALFTQTAFHPLILERTHTFLTEEKDLEWTSEGRLVLVESIGQVFDDLFFSPEAQRMLRALVHHHLSFLPFDLLYKQMCCLPYDTEEPKVQRIFETMFRRSPSDTPIEHTNEVLYFFSDMISDSGIRREREQDPSHRPKHDFYTKVVQTAAQGPWIVWAVYQWAEGFQMESAESSSIENAALRRHFVSLLRQVPTDALHDFFELTLKDLFHLLPHLDPKRELFEDQLLQVKSIVFEHLEERQVQMHHHLDLQSHPLAQSLSLKQDLQEQLLNRASPSPKPRAL